MAMNYKCKNIKIRLAAGTMACALGLAAMPGIMNVRAADISQTGDETAVAILAETMADKTKLQEQIQSAEALNDKAGTYTADTWDVLAAVYAAAVRVNGNDSVSQAEVDAHTASLQAAVAALVSVSTASLQDGLYEINAEIVNAADPSRLSMADGALECESGNVKKPLRLTVRDGQATLRMRFVSLTSDLNGTSFTGYLGKLQYYPDYTDTDRLPGASERIADVDVESTYSQYDEFNDPDFGTDGVMRGKYYPQQISMPVELGDTEIWLKVYVPVMESIAVGCGTQQARLHLDWSEGSLRQIRDDSVDISGLSAQIKQARGLEQGAATEETWQALQAAISTAAKIYDDLSSSQTQIDSQVALLQKTMAAVQAENGTADKSGLQTIIAKAEKLIGKTDIYTSSSLDTLSVVLEYAKGVYDNSTADQTAVDAAVNALTKAINALVEKGNIKTSVLESEISKAEALVKKTKVYTADSIGTLQIAINNAKRVLASDDKTQENVDKQVTSLRNAQKGLIKKAVIDRSVLKKKLDAAQRYAKKTSTYTVSTINSLKAVIKAAKAVYSDSTATQSSVDAQVTALNNAIAGLAKKGDDIKDITKLSDGVYALSGNMVKIDKKTASMSDAAINHTIKLTVRKGKYYVTLKFNGLTVSGKQGYLSKLRYYKSGYTLDKFGSPQGSLASVTVDSYQLSSKGERLSDSLGTDYPHEVTFALIPEAFKDGYVPLQVFVPIMESISSGTGTQPVFLKLDWSSLKATTSNDPDFNKSGSGTGTGESGSSGTSSGGNSSLGGGSGLGGGSSLGGGSGLGGSSSLGGGSGLGGSSKLGSSSLGGSSKLGSSRLGGNGKLGSTQNTGSTGVLGDIGTLGAGLDGSNITAQTLNQENDKAEEPDSVDKTKKSGLEMNTLLLLLIFVGETIMFIYIVAQKRRGR